METTSQKKRIFDSKAFIAVTAVLSVAGVAAWVLETASPTSSSAMSTAQPWGVCMGLFVAFIGLATGGTLVAAGAEAFGWKSLQRASGLAASAGLAASVAGVFYIMSDLGNFGHIMNMLTGLNARSFLTWDMVALPLFMVADIVFLACLKLNRGLKGASWFAIAASLFLLCVDAWIFASTNSREAWNSSLMLPWFIVSAVSSGIAMTVLLGAFAGLRFAGDKPVCYGVACLALADMFLAVTEVVIGLYHGAGVDNQVALVLVAGDLAPLFWSEVACNAAAIVLAIRAASALPRHNAPLAVAGALVIAGVCAKRIYFILSGFAVPLMPQPTAEGIMAYAATHAASAISAPEAVMAAGGFGMLLFLLAIALKLFPLGTAQR